jgi:hypothetical protein
MPISQSRRVHRQLNLGRELARDRDDKGRPAPPAVVVDPLLGEALPVHLYARPQQSAANIPKLEREKALTTLRPAVVKPRTRGAQHLRSLEIPQAKADPPKDEM